MGLTLTRLDVDRIGATAVIRTVNPSDRRQFNELLPWFTPRFVFTHEDREWIRWSVPTEVAKKYGLDAGCACCGEQTILKNADGEGYLVDTLLAETDWWLEDNGYTIPPKEGDPS